MANTEKNFDQYFREKLESHQEKPSALAWERLESRLPKKKKAGFNPLLRIAAAIVLLLSAGIVLLKWSGNDQEASQQVAELTTIEKDSVNQNQEKEDSAIPEILTGLKEDTSDKPVIQEPKSDAAPKQRIRTTQALPSKEPASEKLVAEAITPKEDKKTIEMELPEITLPDLKITEAIAMDQAVEEEPAYKVIIKSRGLKEEAPKQGLIGELEEKVEKIEGLWNKIGQGYADLQDAKENLFANNSPRKERSK